LEDGITTLDMTLDLVLRQKRETTSRSSYRSHIFFEHWH
jgi:hypothetical protein